VAVWQLINPSGSKLLFCWSNYNSSLLNYAFRTFVGSRNAENSSEHELRMLCSSRRRNRHKLKQGTLNIPFLCVCLPIKFRRVPTLCLLMCHPFSLSRGSSAPLLRSNYATRGKYLMGPNAPSFTSSASNHLFIYVCLFVCLFHNLFISLSMNSFFPIVHCITDKLE
jgi:hypothetical protein